jgi:hypothetical protein
MRVNGISFYAVGCSLIVSISCSDHDTGPRPGSDASAGAAGEIAGGGGSTEAESGAAGLSPGVGGRSPGAAGSEGGEGGAPFVPGGTGAEAAGGATAGAAGGFGSEGGANTGGDEGVGSATGTAGAPPSNVTAEQRALCESICAKEPLTNGFAGAPTAPCPNNENCVENICGLIDSYTEPSQFCIDRFTALLTCWNSLPDEAYDCHSIGLLLPFGCAEDENTWFAACQ